MAVTVRSYAKINIGLCIGPPGMRADGFHELRTVYQTIALHDLVTVELRDAEGRSRSVKNKGQDRKSGGLQDQRYPIEIVCNDPRVPTNSTNTCWQAAERMMAVLDISCPVRITIVKRLPMQGGLGGASSNAVATMVGIEREWLRARRGDRHRKPGHSEGPTPEDRLRIAEEIGSDVPLFLLGGTIMGLGRGEQVVPLPDLPEMHLAVATPPIGVSTPAAFAAWDRQFDLPSAQNSASLRFAVGDEVTAAIVKETAETAWRKGKGRLRLTLAGQSAKLNTFSRAVCAWLYGSPVVSGVSARRGNRAEAQLLDLVRTGIANDFEPVVFGQFPELRKVKSAIENAGSVYASLSGSGSTVYGLFKTRTAAVRAARQLNADGIPAVATRTLKRGRA